MAGAGYKLFATGDVLSASDVNTYIMQQTVMVFANSSARTTALSGVLAEGMISYLKDVNTLEVYDGSAWVGATGDITGLTAGTGVAITSATGPVPTVAIDTAVVPQLGSANTFTTSPQRINAASSAIGLIIRGNATTPGNLQEWQDSAGNIYSLVGSSGRFAVRTQSLTGSLNVSTNSAANVGVIVTGVASQTANLQEWQDSSGTVLANVTSAGYVNGSAYRQIGGNSNGFGSGTIASVLTAFSNGGNAAVIPVVVRGASSQTANLQEWQNSAGTVLASVDSAGSSYIGGSLRVSTTATYSARLAVNTAATGNIGLVVRAVASQTANLQEWQDSSGNILAAVRPSGQICAGAVLTGTQLVSVANNATTTGLIVRGAASQVNNLTEWQDSSGSVLASINSNGHFNGIQSLLAQNNAGAIVLRVRGAASQSANLQEWQDSSSTVLAKVLNTGAVYGATLATINSLVIIGEQSSGGSLRMKKLTAAGTNPGADEGRLYFRDGTNAGTLKLVVRAGASGAETTILDNIPQ